MHASYLLICILLTLCLSRAFRVSSIGNHNTPHSSRHVHCVSMSDTKFGSTVHSVLKRTAVASIAALSLASGVWARPEGVNRPDLLPKEQTSVIDVANFLSKGQERRISEKIQQLEEKTGYKLRLLCQSYPETPGLAIKDYWGIDDKTVLLVVDRGEGFNTKGIPSNLMHLNLGSTAEVALPSQFWTRLTNKLGNTPYFKEKGEDIAVINAIEAITFCMEDGKCKDLPFNL